MLRLARGISHSWIAGDLEKLYLSANCAFENCEKINKNHSESFVFNEGSHKKSNPKEGVAILNTFSFINLLIA